MNQNQRIMVFGLFALLLVNSLMAIEMRGSCVSNTPDPDYRCDLSSVCTAQYDCNPASVSDTYGSMQECQTSSTCRTDRTPAQTTTAGKPWQPAVFSALMINAIVLVLFLVVITILKLDQLRHMLYDEWGNMAITVLIAILLIGGMGEAESIARAIGFAFGSQQCSSVSGINYPYCNTVAGASEPPAKLNEWALQVNANQIKLLEAQMKNGLKFNGRLGAVSSVNGFCNLMGVGVSLAGCSGYMTMRGPTGQMLTAMGIGIMETKAEQFLLLVAQNYALVLIVPLGILMRCLHFTRKAGGTVIALGLTLYLVLPTSIIVAQALCDNFLADSAYKRLSFDDNPFPELKTPDLSGSSTPGSDDLECDPFEPDENKLSGTVNSLIDSGGDGSIENGVSRVEQIMFVVVARTLLMGAFVLTVLIMSVRALGHALGSEVDVYALARLS